MDDAGGEGGGEEEEEEGDDDAVDDAVAANGGSDGDVDEDGDDEEEASASIGVASPLASPIWRTGTKDGNGGVKNPTPACAAYNASALNVLVTCSFTLLETNAVMNTGCSGPSK
jgi:hypothetical protein